MAGTDTELLLAVDAALASDAADAPASANEAPALRALRFFASGEDSDRPSRLVKTTPRDRGTTDLLLARGLALEAFWSLDAQLARQAQGIAAGASATLASSVARFVEGVSALLDGRYDDPSLALEADKPASNEPLIRARPQLEALRALAALERGEHEPALRLGRRASLRAQSDLRFEDAALCHLALARMRRAEGRAHLALRIALSVLRGTGAPQAAWAGYEAALAAGAAAWPADAASSSFGTAARAAILAASRGDAPALGAACARLRSDVATAEWMREEVSCLVALLDAREPAGRVGPFLALEVDEAPYGLHWLAPAGSGRDEPLAWIRVAPGEAPRRTLTVGAAAFDLPRLPPEGRASRSSATVAALARARELVTSEELFRAVYGFAFDPALHGNLLRVGLHRARAWLAPVGRIERQGEHLELVPTSAALVPDPSIQARLADRVLQRVGGASGTRAEEIAEALGVPLRSVQREIEMLVEEGALRAERAGGNVGYRVVDTIYSRSGLAARD